METCSLGFGGTPISVVEVYVRYGTSCPTEQPSRMVHVFDRPKLSRARSYQTFFQDSAGGLTKRHEVKYPAGLERDARRRTLGMDVL